MPGRHRLDPEVFNLPVAKMRAGYYSDKYFVRSRDILLAEGYRPRGNDAGVRKELGLSGRYR